MQPIVKPLSLWRRNLVFGLLLAAFLISLPAFIFYATGYRYDFSSDAPTLTATGGFYVSAEASGAEIYINDIYVDNARTFRNASYIQRLEPGVHTLHVQAPGLQTWVKELMVYPGIVTEVEAFNVPEVPQIRLVTEYEAIDGQAVVLPQFASSTALLASTSPFIVATGTATSTYRVNPEFVLLSELFREKASTTVLLGDDSLIPLGGQFGFSTTTASSQSAADAAIPVLSKGALELTFKEGDVYAEVKTSNDWLVPHYFCSEQSLVNDIVDAESVLSSPEEEVVDSFIPATVEIRDGLACRKEIKIDRKEKMVLDYNFYPQSGNVVLMHLEDGLYVVEIDDRVWQNSQLLYAGEDLSMLLYREGIFVEDDGIIFEVATAISAP